MSDASRDQPPPSPATATGPKPPRPPRMSSGALAKLGVTLLVALVIVTLVPNLDQGGTAPSVSLLLITGFMVGVVALSALYWTLTRDLKLPSVVAVYALGFNALIVMVKFVFTPHGIYQVNQEVPLTSNLNINDPLGTLGAAIVVFSLYLTVYWIIYRFFRRRLRVPTKSLRDRIVTKRKTLLAIVGGSVLMAMGSGGFILLLPLLPAFSGVEYLEFVFTSAGSLAIALSLVIATVLANMAFSGVADRAALVGDAALLVSFFWVGLCFLALYHIVWVVYLLVLTSIWPLKVVVPK